jgi:hypothetical protein
VTPPTGPLAPGRPLPPIPVPARPSRPLPTPPVPARPSRPLPTPPGRPVLPTKALPTKVVTTPTGVVSQAALTTEATNATLRITDVAGRPLSQLQTFDTTTNRPVVAVGQPVRLKVQSDPPHPISDIEWSVRGKAVHTSTVQTLEKGTAVPLTGHLRNDLVEFHWIDGLMKTVTVVATVGNERKTASAAFNVLVPTVSECTITTNTFKIFRDGAYKGGDWMVLGERNAEGCQRAATAWAPVWRPGDALGSGQFAFMQLVDSIIAKRNDSTEPGDYDVLSTWDLGAGTAGFVLDAGGANNDQMIVGSGKGVRVAAGKTTVFGPSRFNGDTPGIELPADHYYVFLANEFKLYFVYRSEVPGSIWVTLRKLTWECTGATRRPNLTSAWEEPGDVDVKPALHVATSGVASSELPTWERSTRRGLYEASVSISQFDGELKSMQAAADKDQ